MVYVCACVYVCGVCVCVYVCRFSRYNNINGPTYAFTKLCSVCMYVNYCINVRIYIYIFMCGVVVCIYLCICIAYVNVCML